MARTDTRTNARTPRLIAVSLLAGAAAAAVGCTDAHLNVVHIVPNSLEMGQVAHWTFDDTGGTTVLDSSGFERNGTLMTTGAATPTRVEGQFGGALAFSDGAYMTVPGFPQATESWSVSLWVRLPSGDLGGTDYVTLISNETVFMGGWEMNVVPGAGNDLYHFAFWQGPNDSDYAHYNCSCVDRERWTHLVEVIDGQALTMRLYKDGVPRSAINVRQPIRPGQDTLYFGRWALDEMRGFNGALDDVAIYNRALVLHEVQALSKMPAPIPP
jgi:hypothetical protein